MRIAGLLLAFVASAALAQERTPMRAATDVEKQARTAVVIADYRYGDLLWENDRIAHRIYARALEKEEPPSSSGVDAWGKRVRWPYMDRQLRTGDQHADHGEGLDFYNVGTGRGTGGLGIWHDNKLWVSRNYTRPRIHNSGPQVADFTVDYDAWPVDVARTVSETRRFTLPAGTNFTRMTSTLRSNRRGVMIVGIGISKRPIPPGQLGKITKDAARARLSWWGPTDPAKGTMAAAVVVDPAAFAGFTEDADNYLILVRVQPGKPFVYYSGAAWDRGSDFKTAAEWQNYVDEQRPDFRP
ncbi:DUF4861 family protein [Sphingomonas sp. LT1P40]|uniref:DUF4861 family protein n=1 Tax=Alteristakelama amylovorans TaxID=3096166 RepID=UPI002FCC805E